MEPRDLRAGDTLDRYQLLCRIARGGMGEVWVGRLRGAHGIRRLVALKIIRGEHAEDPSFRSMFLDEARIGVALDHPNAVSTLDLGDQDGFLYYAMEYVDGNSVHRLLREIAAKGVRVPVAVAARVVADACAGLHAAHELRDGKGVPLEVVHRDVSPHNVLVASATGQVKVIDFGIAKARDRLSKDTTSSLLKGKLRYIAPEQIANRGEADRRIDVWGAGVVLYRMLAGRTPFEGDDVEILRALLQREPIPALPSDIPQAVAKVIDELLRHDPNERIPTASEAARRLDEALGQAGLRATSADVAAFVTEHLSGHDASRRAQITAAEEALDGGSIPSSERLRAAAESPRAMRLPTPPTLAIDVELGELTDPASSPSLTGGSLGAASVSRGLGGKPSRSGRVKVLAAALAAVLLFVGGVAVVRARITAAHAVAAAPAKVVAPGDEAPPAVTAPIVSPRPASSPEEPEPTASASSSSPLAAGVAPTPGKAPRPRPAAKPAPTNPDVFSVTNDRK